MIKVTESGVNSYSSVSSTITQGLTFISFIVSQKIEMLKFSTCYTLSHFDHYKN